MKKRSVDLAVMVGVLFASTFDEALADPVAACVARCNAQISLNQNSMAAARLEHQGLSAERDSKGGQLSSLRATIEQRLNEITRASSSINALMQSQSPLMGEHAGISLAIEPLSKTATSLTVAITEYDQAFTEMIKDSQNKIESLIAKYDVLAQTETDSKKADEFRSRAQQLRLLLVLHQKMDIAFAHVIEAIKENKLEKIEQSVDQETFAVLSAFGSAYHKMKTELKSLNENIENLQRRKAVLISEMERIKAQVGDLQRRQFACSDEISKMRNLISNIESRLAAIPRLLQQQIDTINFANQQIAYFSAEIPKCQALRPAPPREPPNRDRGKDGR